MPELFIANGQSYPLQQGTIPATDHGFMFGDSIFETLVAFGDKILNISAHLKRLRSSAQKLNLPIIWSDKQLTEELQQACHSAKLHKIALRLVVSRGTSKTLSIPPKEPHKYLYVMDASVRNTLSPSKIKLKTYLSQLLLDKGYPKISFYLPSIIAKQEVSKQGFNDILWYTSDFLIREASTANIFFITKNNQVVTPKLNRNILSGITRQNILNILQSNNIVSHEKKIHLDDIHCYQAAFLSSTVRGLVPVSFIDQHPLDNDNATFKTIQELYLQRIYQKVGKKVHWTTGKDL